MSAYRDSRPGTRNPRSSLRGGCQDLGMMSTLLPRECGSGARFRRQRVWEAARCEFARWAKLAKVLGMTDSPHVSRQQPRTFPSLDELTLIVRPPGKPLEIKTFTDAQLTEAEVYALEHGAAVERFPLEG